MSIFTRNFPLGTTVALSQSEPAMIQATQVHKTFRTGKIEVHALRGVDLTVRRGEMIAIMGPSGCGKTTLLNCLSGLDEFDEGEVLIEGANLRQMGDRRRTAYRAARMGFVFQTYNLLPVITAVENVELPLLLQRWHPDDSNHYEQCHDRPARRRGANFALPALFGRAQAGAGQNWATQPSPSPRPICLDCYWP